jgi:hypothetical protein
MIIIEIFEENHRFSKKTPHPASLNFVGAATSAVSLPSIGWPGSPLRRGEQRLKTHQRGEWEMAQTETPSADQQALAVIQSSGILNPNVTLGKIMEVTATLAKSSGPVERGVNVFIHPNFVFKLQV